MMRTDYKKYFRYGVIAAAVACAATSVVSAQVNTLYHMKTVSTRHELNPSFQPVPNGYFSTVPVLSGFSIGAGNNSLTLEDVIYPKKIGGEYKTIWFFNENGSIDDFYKTLKTNLHIYSEADFRLFAFGKRLRNSGYMTVGLNTKVSAGVFIPKDLVKLLVYGTPDRNGINAFNFDRFGVRTNVYTELALGYSQTVIPKLVVGGKMKFLVGHANVATKIKRFRLNASKDRWNIEIDGVVNANIPNAEYELDEQNRIENVNTGDMMDDFSAGDLVGGLGLAFDLGANYKLFDDRLTVSASILDLGFIGWKAQNAANIPFKSNVDFDGVEITLENGEAGWDEDYFDNLLDEVEYSTTFKPYTSALAAKILIGAEYGVLNNYLTFGGLSKSTIVNRAVFQEITASVNYLQFDFFNASLSYSLLNGRFGTVGLGLAGRMGPVNIYFAADYLPSKYTGEYIPYKNQAFNLQMGILFNFGYSAKKNADDDKDGVQNRRDKCPDTPAGAVIDKYGCPVQTENQKIQ
jgi:hypothetical protein